jgi:HSP20 family protein
MRQLTPDDLYVWRMRRIWRPPTDVFEVAGDIVIQVEIAGMQEEDFQISLAEQRLVIAGQRCPEEGRRVYQNMEINYGEFRTEVQVNVPLDETGISATYENGFLFVRLPKAREHRVRVQVRSDETRPDEPGSMAGDR